MRENIARGIVRVDAWFLDRAYGAWCDQNRLQERFWLIFANSTARLFFPLARKLDSRAMAEEMVEACWWG